MSLVNKMLRDLQQRQDGSPGFPAADSLRKSRPGRSGGVPLTVGLGFAGVAGLALLWGLSGWLSNLFSPAPVPIPVPVAITGPASVAPVAPKPAPLLVPPSIPPAAAPKTLPSMAAPVHAGPVTTTPRAPVVAAPVRPVAPSRTVFVTTPPNRMAAGEVALPLHPDRLPGALGGREPSAAPVPATAFARAETAYREGLAAYRDNRLDRSLDALQKSLEIYPGHLPARELLADQLELSGRIDEALDILRKGLAIAPDYTAFRKRAARILLDRNLSAEACRVLVGNGLPRVADDPELHVLLASTYRRLAEHFLEAQTYRNLLVRFPRDGALWVGLGSALEAGGQGEEARQAFRQALATGGLSPELAARASAAVSR